MRRRLPMLGVVLWLSVALVVATGAALLIRFDRVVVAPGRLAGGSVAVRSPRAGTVASVSAKPGDRMTAGGLVLRLDVEELEAEATQLEIRIAHLEERVRSLREELDRLVRVLHPHERERAGRAVQRAKLELSQAEVEAQAIKSLGEEGLAGRLEVETAELKRKLAVMALDEAEQAVPLLEAQQQSRLAAVDAEIASLEGEIAEERTRLEENQRQREMSEVSAGVSGVVIGNDLADLSGRFVARGDELLRLAVAPAERFEGTLNDIGRAPIRAGLPAKIRLDGYPWLVHGAVTGRVEQVSDRRDASGGFPVTLSFDAGGAPGPLYEGMRGDARIVVEQKVSLGRLLLERFTGAGRP